MENIKKPQLYETFDLVTAAKYPPKKVAFMPLPCAVIASCHKRRGNWKENIVRRVPAVFTCVCKVPKEPSFATLCRQCFSRTVLSSEHGPRRTEES